MQKDVELWELAKMIDQSLLHPTMGEALIVDGCNLAREYQVATVCVKPYCVSLVRDHLRGTKVGVCSVVGFPHGNSKTEIKLFEIKEAIQDGANEIDAVINIAKVKDGNWDYVKKEIEALNNTTRKNGAILKVIFETDYLNDQEVVALCEICAACEVAFAKTSTGYGFVRQPNGYYSYAGATEHFLRIMINTCGERVQVKAAGGIRCLDDLLFVKELGVTRIGATATKSILDEAIARGYQ